jgi:hypothetical protein
VEECAGFWISGAGCSVERSWTLEERLGGFVLLIVSDTHYVLPEDPDPSNNCWILCTRYISLLTYIVGLTMAFAVLGPRTEVYTGSTSSICNM